MSVKKLIQRVTKPELTPEQFEKLQHPDSRRTDVACHIHECTYGVNSSPLARLALTFSALVHDVGKHKRVGIDICYPTVLVEGAIALI